MEHGVQVSIDQETCIGCGYCSSLESETFSFPTPKPNFPTPRAGVLKAGEEVSEVLVSITDPRYQNVLLAVSECPVNAINAKEANLIEATDNDDR